MNDSTSRLPRPLYRAQDVRQLDKIAIEKHGIEGFKLMQRAGAVTFNALLEQWPQTRHVRVFAGAGNNAGDGYVIARLAQEHGLHSEVIQVGDPEGLQGDARRALDWAMETKVDMLSLADYMASDAVERNDESPNTVMVDALLGTGLARAVSGTYAQAITHINDSSAAIVAVDIPSGLSANTGMPSGVTVAADLTVTFIGMKQGLHTGRGRDFAGKIVFSDLDIPENVYTNVDAPAVSAYRIDINDATRHLQPRAVSSHKSQHGHVVVVGGDFNYGGAVLLAAEAALRAGAGLVSVITRSVHRPAILARRPELMVLGTEDENVDIEALLSKASAIAIGTGLGTGAWSRALLQQALSAQSSFRIPLVIDADGLRLLAEKPAGTTGSKRNNWILTPHPGEAAQLLDCTVDEVQQDRFAAVAALQSKWGGSCLLKGSGSLICCMESDAPKISLSTEGNPGMATAGMGDVLSGIAASLLAQGLDPADSLKCAVVIHGEAADLAMQVAGPRGMLASDLFPYIQRLVNPASL